MYNSKFLSLLCKLSDNWERRIECRVSLANHINRVQIDVRVCFPRAVARWTWLTDDHSSVAYTLRGKDFHMWQRSRVLQTITFQWVSTQIIVWVIVSSFIGCMCVACIAQLSWSDVSGGWVATMYVCITDITAADLTSPTWLSACLWSTKVLESIRRWLQVVLLVVMRLYLYLCLQ